MENLLEIESAIERLPVNDRFKLIERLEVKAGDSWDEQFESDVMAGRLDEIAEKALLEHRKGQSTRVPRNGE